MDPVGTITSGSGWVVGLPKIELHLHLEGSMRSATVCDLTRDRLGWSGVLEPGWESTYYTYTDFAGFMKQLTPRFPYTPEEYGRIARECFADLARQNVVYAEVSFELPVKEVGDDLRFWPVVESIERERRLAEEAHPIRIGIIAGLQREMPVEVAVYRVQLARLARDRGMGIVGIDLHGDEETRPPAPFGPAYDLAGDYGLGLRAHAGEAAGAASIWSAINVLGARRIAHGVRSLEDPSLLDRLQVGDVTLELCPTSNVRTGAVSNLAAHPICTFYQLGIPVTVNSDDPLPFFTDIEREYRLLVDEFGCDREVLREITGTAARAAFQPETEKVRLMELVAEAYDSPLGDVG